jgi:hypothetical protein
VVARGDDGESTDASLNRSANRLLPAECSTDEFRRAATALLNVAPRIAVDDRAQLRLNSEAGTTECPQVENLSPSGMLFAALTPLPVGTVIGFGLQLPDRREPIRGKAEVVRLAPSTKTGEHRIGVRFLALGGEAPEQLRALVALDSANENEPGSAAASATSPPLDSRFASAPATSDSLSALNPGDLERYREELAELTPVLDEALERGLRRRLRVADWYVTGAELGLETLRAFSTILASIYENRTLGSEASRRLSDLVEVRRRLAEFGRPQQLVATRVQIMLELRPALERLLRELVDGRDDSRAASPGRPLGVVAQATVEIKRMVGLKRGLENLLDQLEELQSPRFLMARGAIRRSVERIHREYASLAGALGIALDPAQLASRRQLRSATHAVEREVRGLERRLTTIHQRTYTGEVRKLASGDPEADLIDPRLHQILNDTLSAGAEFLVRAYSAYRHALEVTGSDPALIERVERLNALTSETQESLEKAATGVRTPPPGIRTAVDGSGTSWSSAASQAADAREPN